ncbi:hypothetical protein M8997_021555 [Phyllobacterium sp. 21LDTY02-6]|jgi:hypothetical protein|uniref:hypothetical protein n=1 Tax=unclassified Phyllobacterium TaxID=2638441 RepID=UPI0020221E1E|nr:MULTISPECIES: hypothetical protein [unclassified Phyllobacterium]MCO4319779.1 hypothetical protein [Phyllobacterium sp. 21LDTY02-6]MCX8280520.1 hypothetical protein [Phyllobacterium sp. 0TCS1.6C]MCX8295031.1 hypothetical protein [Phyllobacterium sp. 0TCS1.6A]
MKPVLQSTTARETARADYLASHYGAIGPAAVRAAIAAMVRKRPTLKLASIVQETD